MKRKKLYAALVLGFLAIGSQAISAENFVRIRIGSSSYSSRAKLIKRVHRLERAVNQLQDQLSYMNAQTQISEVIHEPMTTCYIHTSFNGTFHYTAATQTEARANVLENCQQKSSGSLECSERKVKCGQ